MSKSEVLYVKGNNNYETDDEDRWDDRKLNDAFDRALQRSGAQVAKSLAMSTNTSMSPNSSSEHQKKTAKSSMKKDRMPKVSKNIMVDETPKEEIWSPGMPCRLVYNEDGLEYEAVIVNLVENDDCIVKYLGYENQEMVPLDALMSSHGKEARSQQIAEATPEQVDENLGTASPIMDTVDPAYSDQVPSPDSMGNMERTNSKKKKSSKKKKNQAKNLTINGFEFPEIPHALKNQLASEMPMPPPPLPPMGFSSSLHQIDSEDQAISSMLLSWYMSGYHTGLYAGLKSFQQLTSVMPMPPPPLPPMAFSSSLDQIDSEDQAMSSMLLSWYMCGYHSGVFAGIKRSKEGRRN